LHAVAAIGAGVVAGHEAADHELAGLDGGDGAADLLDDAAVLVTDRPGLSDRIDAAVGPQVRSADACGHRADDGVGRFDDYRVGALLIAHITRGMKNSSSHTDPPIPIAPRLVV